MRIANKDGENIGTMPWEFEGKLTFFYTYLHGKLNTELHTGDLHRWKDYIEYDKEPEIDFSESKASASLKGDFLSELEKLAEHLVGENTEMQQILAAQQEVYEKKEEERKKREAKRKAKAKQAKKK